MIEKKTIGIPRGLLYYEHGTIWEQFFKQLGFRVVVSDKTNSKVLNNGVIYCTNDTCLPIKVFHGHIMTLKDKADYIFVPRYSSTRKSEFCCPKLCGLPDMVLYNLKEKLNLIEIKINENAKKETYASLKNISKTLGIHYHQVLTTFENIVGKHLAGEEDALKKHSRVKKKKIAVLGHPYMIYDEYLSMNLINKLTEQEYDVCTPIDLEAELKRANAYPYNGDSKTFYSVGLDNLGSAFSFLKDSGICGMIYLTPFACGVDSMVIEFIERRLSQQTSVPLMKLTVDEHTGEAGFDTRLEAFLDMIA